METMEGAVLGSLLFWSEYAPKVQKKKPPPALPAAAHNPEVVGSNPAPATIKP